MSVNTTSSKVQYAGNNSDVTPYVIPFPFLSVDYINATVSQDGVAEEVALDPSEYVVTRLGDGSGGSLVTDVAVPLAGTITIYRQTPLLQSTSFQYAGPLPSKDIEQGLDRMMMVVQELYRRYTEGSSLELDASNVTSGVFLPARLGTGTADNTKFLRGDNTWTSLTPAGSSGQLQYNNAGAFGAAANLWYSANTLDVYNGTSAQALRLWNTRTDAANYQRGGSRWNGSRLEIFTEGLGTGASSFYFNSLFFWLNSGAISRNSARTSIADPAARGEDAIDFQAWRDTSNTRAATGPGSALMGGRNNTASGQSSFGGCGETNIASGLSSATLGGNLNTASGSYSVTLAGQSNTAGGTYSAVLGGLSNAASGSLATASGYGALASQYAQQAYASGYFSVVGDAQISRWTLRHSTTNATETTLYVDGDSGSSVCPLIGAPEAIAYRLVVIGKTSGAMPQMFVGERRFYVSNEPPGTAASMRGSIETIGTDLNTNTFGGITTIAVDAMTSQLLIKVTGKAATPMRWVAYLEALSVSY